MTLSIQTIAAIDLQGELTQGSLLRGKVPAGAHVWLDDKKVKVSPYGHFAIGFGRDAPLEHQLSWALKDGKRQNSTIVLSKREYATQHIEGLAPKMVSPPKEVLTRIAQDNRQVAAARKRDDERLDFWQPFIWPADGPISGVYGSQRVLNGVPKRPHYGVDVAAPVGTPVYAPADGIVTLWVPDMYYSGGTMIIDHGFGVSSTFLHLHAGHVEVGSQVKQGQLVAEIGATGRVTGAHLDWRMNWLSERLDPALLVPKPSASKMD
ncbi:M23 family metallopeptidase [Aliiglaciecola sp. LCG003]|uniref:M23 family metallopeptidase n=1 Tax=Aliiglaciecola sp. LCG003 TaxID=3053655 RepID=UPI002573696E|nr:M23 family metallopeptidase [Aliiglaciecola sp. LCG003]WJG11286.1 M23 family metallopeptidase [Aliiglaciecola sp. LCG003]